MADLLARVAEHIGAAGVDAAGRMRCPRCGGDFGPTLPLSFLGVFELGYLPGAPLLAGACLDCGHIVEPKATEVATPAAPDQSVEAADASFTDRRA